MTTAAERFARLSTPAKLLLILTAALLPIGFGLGWIAYKGLREANGALQAQANDKGRAAARGIESLVARNALALRIASNGRFSTPDPCAEVQRSLTIAPAVGQQFRLETADGNELCSIGDIGDTGLLAPIAPGDIRLRVAPDEDSLIVQVGVVGGAATTTLSTSDLRSAALEGGTDVDGIALEDGQRQIDILAADMNNMLVGHEPSKTRWAIGNGRLFAEVETQVPRITV